MNSSSPLSNLSDDSSRNIWVFNSIGFPSGSQVNRPNAPVRMIFPFTDEVNAPGSEFFALRVNIFNMEYGRRPILGDRVVDTLTMRPRYLL